MSLNTYTLTVRCYRWYAETDAFAVQIQAGGSYRNAVYRIANYYRLGVSEREVEDALDARVEAL